MASQIRSVAHVRNFVLQMGRFLLSLVITIGLLGVSIPRVQAAGETISGKISSAVNGSPISGLAVVAVNDNNDWVTTVLTDGNGDYVLQGLAYGNYRILACADCNDATKAYVNTYYGGAYDFESATSIPFSEGVSPTGKDISLLPGNTIQGKVTDNGNVAIEGIPIGAVVWDADTEQWTWFKSVDTASDGSYHLTGLPDGDYYVQACPECSGKYFLGEYYDGKRNIEDARPFQLTNAFTQSGVDFTLEPAAIITGHVADSGGNARANVPVSADNLDGEANFNTWTDQNGNYSLNVRPGRYHVHTQLNWNSEYNAINLTDQYYNHHASAGDADTLTLSVNTTTPNVDFSLQPGNTITGTVTDIAQPPVNLKDIKVAAIRWDTGEWLKDVMTDDTGAYTLTGLPDGNYRIQACPDCTQQPYLGRYYNNTEYYDEATPLSLSGSGTKSGIDFTLTPAALISGRTTAGDGTTALGNIPVFAENAQTGEGFSAWSDNNGNYTIYVKPGFYRLRTMVEWNSELDSLNYVNQIYDRALNLEEAPLIQAVLDISQTGKNFALEQGGILSGTIRDGSGAPLGSATVMAVAADGSRHSFGSQPTGPDGVYTLRGLPAGNYVIRAMHEGSQALYYGGNSNWNTDNPVTITAGATTAGKNFNLPAQSGEDPNLLTVRQSAEIADMYDPGWVEYVQNANLVDQIFAGMTRIDPADGSTLSNLSNSWLSSDNIHWVFTMRNDLVWSDGSPLTAADIRFALLRNLKMNGVVDDMLIIQGAETYSQGLVGADQVGITLDGSDPANTIHFALTQKVAFFPTLMSTMAARPQPQMLIQAFPDSWLSLDKLITSGPYRLIEHDSEHVLLQKNPNFIDADKVQVQQVVMKSGSQTEEAWNQYLSGELDTAVIPPAKIAAAKNDPAIQGQLNLVSQQCTFFIGFNSDQIESILGLTGENAALFRRALIEAINRSDFNAQTGAGSMTAWTYIAPGVLGHSDENSAIYPVYNTTQAAADITAAMGDNYTLPAIPLYYASDAPNASIQRAQMEFLANTWNQVLNAHFTVAGVTQEQYTAMILSGQMLATRRGWCSDYNDGYNFLSSLSFMDAIFGGWQNATYDRLLSDAASSSSEVVRAYIYHDAEEILLKTDAILMPLNYTTSPILSRGFVRSFGVGGLDYIADWTLERTDTMTVGVPTSASLSSGQATSVFTPGGEEGRVSYTIPAGAFADGTTLIHTGHLTYDLANLPEGTQKTSLYFTFAAENSSHAQVAPTLNYTLSVHYAQTEVDALGLRESSLALYCWDETNSRWVKDAGSRVDPATNTITSSSRREGQWLVLGSSGDVKVFVPIVMR